jgi:hypothetical protein
LTDKLFLEKVSKKDYITEKQEKIKTTARGIIILAIFIIIFIAVIIRFALRADVNNGLPSPMPSGKDAYEIAKDYILPALKPANAEFPDIDYQITKNPDSIYIITSYFETRELNGQNSKTDFTVTLKFKGGAALDQQNWTLIKLKKQ